MGKLMDYKRNFLKFHKISQDQFERLYLDFMKTRKDEAAWRAFAGKWSIRIIEDDQLPSETCAVLSVNLTVIKILSNSEEEAHNNIQEVLSQIGKLQ